MLPCDDEPWERLPRPIAIRSLLLRVGKNFVLDRTVGNDLARFFPQLARHLSEFDDAKTFPRSTVASICRVKNGMLVTADSEYGALLRLPSKSPWGIVLVPLKDSAQTDVLRRMSESSLMFRPSAERTGMLEYLRRNRLLLDFLYSAPIVTVRSDCCWSGGAIPS